MDKKRKEIEDEEKIDVKNIYLRNFKPHQPRVGKEYQAIIPECITAPKIKENKIENIQKTKINNEGNIIIDKDKSNINKQNEENFINKNEILGHKTKVEKNEKNDDVDEFVPQKKKKIC